MIYKILLFFLHLYWSIIALQCCQFLLYNKVNQLYIYIYPHISSLLRLPPTLPILPLQVVTRHRADLPVLFGCFPLAIYFTFSSVRTGSHCTYYYAFFFNLVMLQKSFHVQKSIIILILPSIVQYSIVWTYHNLFNQSIDGHVSCSHTFWQTLFEAFPTILGPPYPAGDKSRILLRDTSIIVIKEKIFTF